MKKIIFLFILILAIPLTLCAQEEEDTSLVASFYRFDIDFGRSFDYAKVNQKRTLEMMGKESISMGVVSMVAIIVVNGILASRNNWNLWIDIPMATAVSLASIVPFSILSNNLKKSADAILIDSLPRTVLGLSPEAAFSEMQKKEEYYSSKYGTQHKKYAECLLWCSRIYAELGDEVQARRTLRQSDRLFRQTGEGFFNGRDSVEEIFRLDVQTIIDENDGKEFAALMHAKKSCQMKASTFGDTSSVYLNSLLDLSRRYANRLQYGKSQKIHTIGYDSYVELIKREFCQRSENKRTLYWNTARRYIGKTIDLAYASSSRWRRGFSSEMASATYNALLLSKGILLNTTINFENYIMTSGINDAIEALELKKNLSLGGADQRILDSLDYVILQILSHNNQAFHLPQLSITWKDVQNSLGQDDLAVEFFRNTVGEYGAVLLKKKWKNPKLVSLNNYISLHDGHKMALDEALRNPTHTDAWTISYSVWTDDIMKHFPQTDTGKVFFAADGELQLAGIEYLPILKEDSVYYCMSDFYNLCRVSSTRILVKDAPLASDNSAAVYGGLKYDYSMVPSSSSPLDSVLISSFDSTSSQHRHRSADGLLYLEGSKIEVDSITEIIKNSQVEKCLINVYTDSNGTEESFKALSGKRNRIIHLATHGFFIHQYDTLLQETLSLGNNPLSWSGLCMAGAEEKWCDGVSPANREDGLLTALEIASLDLRGVDLVVLSACESARGSISSDGVFGLQRGFKMAGVKSILMSLWKVDDEATCMLMTEFYKNWISKKMTKHDALEEAKKTVRSHKEKGWDDPRYWAAFILLDALD